jgi:hypothetical protein
MFSGTTARYTGRQRRLLALLLFAWLNLLMQPCVAGLPPMPVAAEHCDHGSGTDHAVPCAAMQATACEMQAELNADSPPPASVRRVSTLLAVLPVDDADAGTIRAWSGNADPARASAPHLSIRFCNLRN